MAELAEPSGQVSLENNNHLSSWAQADSKLHSNYSDFSDVFAPLHENSKQSSDDDYNSNQSASINRSTPATDISEKKLLKLEPGEGRTQSQFSESNNETTSNTGNVDCVVCGDKASGKHYGQNSCEGCKSFFKRSVRRNLSYTCRGNRCCPVDIQHRNQCQYCRLQKCIKLGMRKEAVQRGRMAHASFSGFHQLPYSIPASSWSESASQIGMTTLIHLLMKADQTQMRHNVSIASGLDPFNSETARLLTSVIEWIRNIPHFMDLIPNDQFLLVSSSWHIIFILTVSQYSMSNLLYSGSVSSPFHHDSLRGIVEVVDKLKTLNADAVEHICLKALAIFNPECPGLQDAPGVEAVQTKVQWALEEYCRTHYGSQPDRFGRLVLRLTSLSLVPAHRIETYFFSRLLNRSGVLSMDRMLRDLLLGQQPIPSQQPHALPPPNSYPYSFGAS